MTVPLPCPPTATDASEVVTRKRRRRAAPSGAADDCFACHKRNVKCDRRRPYCSPCLEIGSECSGYKTQLTWGVGVASRGKLRGLSLPVAKSAPAAKSPPKSYTRPRATSTITKVPFDKQIGDDEVEIKVEGEMPLSVSPFFNYDFVHMNPKSASLMDSPAPNSDWAGTQEHIQVTNSRPVESHGHFLRQSLQRLQPPMMRYGEDLMSSSTGSLSGYSETDYSPVAHSFTVDDAPFLTSPMPLYDGFSRGTAADQASLYGMSADHHRGPTSCPDQYYPHSDLSSSISSHLYIDENRRSATSPAIATQSDTEYTDYDDDIIGMSNSRGSDAFLTAPVDKASWVSIQEEDYTQQQDEDLSDRIPGSLNIGLLPDVSPRLNFYMNYYEKIICPITVAIDSPSNPYRRNILSLAAESQSLQHAICALASCNLRMRRKNSLGQQNWMQRSEERREFGSGYHRPSNLSNTPDTSLDDASVQEEYQHRSLAVSLLNAQLSNPTLAKHDSVLATLLMLCHYRMCETGTAQFKTQFAGVKKLLGMRASGVETGNWGWMETHFTFFDAITASVNDREAQLRGGYLDMVASPWDSSSALENLAGCDGRLFRTIATLGRLNLLSQNRAVLDPLNNSRTPSVSEATPTITQSTLTELYSQYSQQFSGNLSSFNADSPPMASPSPPPASDSRQEFWSEWRSCRHALQTWTFSPATLVASLHPIVPTANQIRDFGFVSEAFRHAALLYTERLAAPQLPSTHITFQQHVSQVLFYVTSLGEGSDAMGKFLLWPLFVAGSEAVGDVERGVVRDRCNGITRRGGYANNLAGLEVLERIWKSGSQAGSEGMDMRQGQGQGQGHRGAFAWERWMRDVDGEFIMV